METAEPEKSLVDGLSRDDFVKFVTSCIKLMSPDDFRAVWPNLPCSLRAVSLELPPGRKHPGKEASKAARSCSGMFSCGGKGECVYRCRRIHSLACESVES